MILDPHAPPEDAGKVSRAISMLDMVVNAVPMEPARKEIIVTFEADVRVDDAEDVLHAISMIKSVASCQRVGADLVRDSLIASKIYYDAKKKALHFLSAGRPLHSDTPLSSDQVGDFIITQRVRRKITHKIWKALEDCEP